MTRRLLFSYLTVTLVVLILLELPLAVFYRQREVDRLAAAAERDATVLASIYEDGLEKNLSLDPTAADEYRTDTTARVVVVDLAGISVVDSDAEIDRDFSTRPEIEVALSGRRSTGIRRSDTLDTELLYIAVPIASGGTVHGALRLTLDTQEVTERVWRFWVALVAIGVVVLVVIGGVGFAIARSVTRPVRRLQAAADRFSGGDLTPDPLDSSAPRELAALQRAMNDMAVQLDGLIERQRAFVADASHQLRTPLTALRLHLENIESQVSAPTTGQVEAAIDEADRLGVLVDDLLQLAQAERSGNTTAVDLAVTVGDRVDTWTATAELHDVVLASSIGSTDLPVVACAIPGGVEQILDNVIDNAIRAAPARTTVSVELVVGSEEHCVVVRDRGPGLDDDDKASALSRFWRADTSSPGSGLGLAIASSIAQASGGSLRLSDNDPTGLIVTLALPAAATDHTTVAPAAPCDQEKFSK